MTTQELLAADNVIDRLYMKYRQQYEPFELLQVIADDLNTIFTAHNYDREFVKARIIKILGYQETLQKLIQMPKVEQRSTEWYEMRQTRITASDFAQALGEGKFGTQRDFYKKKCGYEKDTFDNNAAPLKWGIKYEPVAIEAYAHKNKVKMIEFGLLPHPNISWFGASPDSITELGVMVEIKCPWKRKITGEVPKQYYYQMQGQLDVCSLEECDFLECEFLEYYDENEFKNHFWDNTNEKGIIIEYLQQGDTHYVYSPFEHHKNLDMTMKWKTQALDALQKEANKSLSKIYYWQLITFSVVRVYRDKSFLEVKMPQLKEVWDKIIQYKKNKDLYDAEMNAPKPLKNPVCQEINIDMFDAPPLSETSTSVSFHLDTKLQQQGSQSFNKVRLGGDIKMTGYAFLSDSDTEN